MHRIRTRLSDGREIVYYSRAGQLNPPPVDRRGLPPVAARSEVRHDPVTGDWVVVAGHRQGRGFQPQADDCPLCPSREGRLTEVPADDYEVVVFENRFPALGGEVDLGAPAAAAHRGPLLVSRPGVGRCEVICFASQHDTSFADLKPDQARLVLDVWTDRTRELGARAGVVEVFCFENRGAEMGVSQSHPHGQIYAYPFVTPRTERMLGRARAHREQHGRNLFDDVVAAELADGRRIVRATDEWVAFVPHAARWPYEVHLYPRRRRSDLTSLDDAQRDGFAPIYLDLLQRFERLFTGTTPYVSAWHQAPAAAAAARADELAVHLELFTNRRSADRFKVLGGTEVAMESYSNDVGPELAADRLREVAHR